MIDEWSFAIHFNNEPYVRVESQEMAERCTDERAEKIRGIQQRLETSGDPDADTDYFNTVVFILELLENEYQAHIFDPMEGSFI